MHVMVMFMMRPAAALAPALLASIAAAGGPPNDDCGDAQVIPGDVVTFDPPAYGTTGAGGELCSAVESCEKLAAGSSNSVWYSYTPDQDGTVEINTFGSSYDTVLSVFDGCGGGIPPFCSTPVELACDDDAPLTTASQLYLDVDGGQTYLIRVADYDAAPGGGTLDFNILYRPPNDFCATPTAIDSTAYDPPLLRTDHALTDLCEADESCEFNGIGVSNSVWYLFHCVSDGLLTVDTEGSSYDTVLSIFDGCGEFQGLEVPCGVPAELACDDDAGVGVTSRISDFPVSGGVTYLIKVADYNVNQGGGDLDFNATFVAAPGPCPQDINNDGAVDVNDLLDVLGAWGMCE